MTPVTMGCSSPQPLWIIIFTRTVRNVVEEVSIEELGKMVTSVNDSNEDTMDEEGSTVGKDEDQILIVKHLEFLVQVKAVLERYGALLAD